MNLAVYKDLKRLMHEYKRTGSKANRHRQSRRIEIGVEDILNNEPKVHHLDGIGRNQIIRFWARHEDLSQKTRMAYWYGFKFLFERLGKALPPKPRENKREKPEIH